MTSSPAEIYDPYLYKIAIEGAYPLRREQDLSKDERVEILRSHPALSCRLFHIKQDILWETVIMGRHKPLGQVIDYWRRTEFQFKGSPHEHCLVAVASDGIVAEDVCSTDEARTDLVKGMIKRTLTACLKINGNIVPELRHILDGNEHDIESFD